MTAPAAPARSGFSMRLPGREEAAPEEEAADKGPDVLAPDALVDVAGERRSSGVDAILERLDRELVGLAPVKTKIAEIAALLLVDRLRRRFGLASSRPTMHMSFTGSPGTGKTTVAMRMGELLTALGYLSKGHLVAVSRDDLVGQYVGHTAPKTKEVLKRAMGGVLFIDEAYSLMRVENERDYGRETIEVLLQVMEEHRDDLIVVLAGYPDRMETFFHSNPGMSSRIAHHIEFPEYTLEELLAIGELMLTSDDYELSAEARDTFRAYLERRMRQPRFANARSVRNGLERAWLRQASRLVSAQGMRSRDDLRRLESEDFLASRVFTDDEAGGGADGDADEA